MALAFADALSISDALFIQAHEPPSPPPPLTSPITSPLTSPVLAPIDNGGPNNLIGAGGSGGMTMVAMGAGGAVALVLLSFLILRRRTRLCGGKRSASDLAADLYQSNYGGPRHDVGPTRGRGGSIGADANRGRGGGSVGHVVGHVGQLFSAELGGDGGGALPPVQAGGAVVRYESTKSTERRPPAKCGRGVSGRCMNPSMLAMMSRFKSKERRLGAGGTASNGPPATSQESRVRMYNIRQEDRVSPA